jgi:Tol biopolymer transport system component
VRGERGMGQRIARVLAAGLAVAAAAPARAQGTTGRASVGPRGAQADGLSDRPALSADGRAVAFVSLAANLVPRDTNGWADVFVRDRRRGRTELASVSSGGVRGDWPSGNPSLSADGRFVAFGSFATTLVSGDTNGTSDVFVRDREAGTTERVSVSSRGAQGGGYSDWPSLSADGRFVAFASDARNLVPGDTNGRQDVFVRDRLKGTTQRVSLGPRGAQGDRDSGGFGGVAVSADGRFVAFYSDATNLVPGDTNGTWDVFVRDRARGTTERVNVGRGGAQDDGSGAWDVAISADGRSVAFASDGTNLVPGDTNGWADVFVHDRARRTTERVSVSSGGAQGGWDSSGPSLSADGRLVAFWGPSDLAPGGAAGLADVFVRDRRTGRTERASVSSGGARGDGGSYEPSLSADGRLVAFSSDATNLVPGDTNGRRDIFVRARRAGPGG